MYKPWFSEADEQAMQRRPEAYVAVLWGARELLRTGKRKRVAAAIADAGVALFGPVVKWWRPLCEEAVANLLDARALPGALAATYAARPRVQVVAKYDEHPDPQRAARLLDDVARYVVDDWCDAMAVSRCVTLGYRTDGLANDPPVDFTVLRPERHNFIGDPSHPDGRRLLPRLAWVVPDDELVAKLQSIGRGLFDRLLERKLGIDEAAVVGDKTAVTIGYRAGAPRGDGTFDAVQVLDVSLVDHAHLIDPHAQITREQLLTLNDLAGGVVAKLPVKHLPDVARAITDGLAGERHRPSGEPSLARSLALPISMEIEDRRELIELPSGRTFYGMRKDGPEKVVRFTAPTVADGRRLHTPGLDLWDDFEKNPVVVWQHDGIPCGRLVKQDDRGERTYSFEQASWIDPVPVEEVRAFERRVNAAAGKGPRHECPPPITRSSMGLVVELLKMADMPAELLDHFRRCFYIPDQGAFLRGEEGWTGDESRALTVLQEAAWSDVLKTRREQLLLALTRRARHEEEEHRGYVLTALNGDRIMSFAKGAPAPDVDGMPFKQWRDETKGRVAWIALPQEPVVPVWALEAVLAAAPRDAFVQGLHHDWQCAELRVCFRSATFPLIEEGTMARGVSAQWDHEARTVKVEWPVREDLENPKP